MCQFANWLQGVALCRNPGHYGWTTEGENPMANLYSVLVPHEPQESETCLLTLEQAMDICWSLAEDFGYAEIRDPHGNHVGDYGDPSVFFA